MAVLLLFEPFVEVDAFGIFPGGAGEEMEMTDEDLGIDVEQPFGFAGRRLRGVGGSFSRGRGGRGFFCFFDPTHFHGLVVDFLEIYEGEAAERGRELRAGRLECGWQAYLRRGIRG